MYRIITHDDQSLTDHLDYVRYILDRENTPHLMVVEAIIYF